MHLRNQSNVKKIPAAIRGLKCHNANTFTVFFLKIFKLYETQKPNRSLSTFTRTADNSPIWHIPVEILENTTANSLALTCSSNICGGFWSNNQDSVPCEASSSVDNAHFSVRSQTPSRDLLSFFFSFGYYHMNDHGFTGLTQTKPLSSLHILAHKTPLLWGGKAGKEGAAHFVCVCVCT